MAEQQAATPTDAAPDTASLDDRILASFGIGETEEAQGGHEAKPAEGQHSEDPETDPVIEEEVVVEEPVAEFELKHNGEVKKVPVTEAQRLAQMGYDYEFKMARVHDDAQKVQSMVQAAQAQFTMKAQALDALAEAKSYERQLKPFANVDWAQASMTDPQGAFQARMQYDQLVAAYNHSMQQVNQLQQPIQQAQQQMDAATQALEAKKLTERIPEWKDPARYKQDSSAILETMVKSYGFRPEDASHPLLNDHRFVSVLRDAWKYREAMNTKGKKGLPQGLPGVARPGAKPLPRSNAQSLGDIKRGLRQVQSKDARKALEDRLIEQKFGLK